MKMASHRTMFHALSLLLLLINLSFCQNGILYPQESESRELKSLDGIWNFRTAPRNDPDLGFLDHWYDRPLDQTGEVELMPVPSSYNDITQSKLIRDHIGWAWYDHSFRIPQGWAKDKRIFLRFGGVNYHAIVWINGVQVMEHAGGHLPFLTELSVDNLSLETSNRITVAVNNTLTLDTVPQGEVVRATDPRYPPGYFTMKYDFDFFNYAGIHRTVYLYTTPESYIEDISVNSSVSGTTGYVDYSVNFIAKRFQKVAYKLNLASVLLEDKQGNVVAAGSTDSGRLTVNNAKLWWPFTMVANESDAGYLYTLVVKLHDAGQGTTDIYRLKVGIRTIKWTDSSFLINDRPFYFRGFGRHEDFSIRGKGIDNVMIVKDHNLVKWTGANSYRTSHYPYSEEIMDLTDRLGIVIIDECSAVSLKQFGPKLLANHKQQMRELIQRDKNRASVVMWSVGNEPQSQEASSELYFKEIVQLTKSMDQYRPVTLVINKAWNADRAAQFVDIICINRYFSWYSDTGHTEVIQKSLIMDVENWIGKFKKPIIVAEYGSDTVAGIHTSPEYVFSEEYQLEMMKEHFKAFDFLRNSTSLIGEMIWNFADFMTDQGITRVSGNRKGIFTRERQPKASAHYIRKRYHLLAQESDGFPLPTNLGHEQPIYTQH